MDFLTPEERETLAQSLVCKECGHADALHTVSYDGHWDHCNVKDCHCSPSWYGFNFVPRGEKDASTSLEA